ncbi:hypothetical protein BDN70DRAFT_897474 [Pholiota conissans]|uniref:Uncharacterized protein n=1 Tax=Pholiota conissans TaxID=109636 RepID=A0A9P5YUW1_9AGAR|nr:hypothetical protein BDN70DRAFT_897474 [Pholiota conissans]
MTSELASLWFRWGTLPTYELNEYGTLRYIHCHKVTCNSTSKPVQAQALTCYHSSSDTDCAHSSRRTSEHKLQVSFEHAWEQVASSGFSAFGGQQLGESWTLTGLALPNCNKAATGGTTLWRKGDLRIILKGEKMK